MKPILSTTKLNVEVQIKMKLYIFLIIVTLKRKLTWEAGLVSTSLTQQRGFLVLPECGDLDKLGVERLVTPHQVSLEVVRRLIEGAAQVLVGNGQMAKFDPFLSLDCARVEGVGAQSKERKGSNFAA